MEITFEGIPSGDHECFCWDVDRETFIRLMGHEPEEEERFTFDRSHFNKGLYKVYPSDVMRLPHTDQKLVFTIKVSRGVGQCLRCGKTILYEEALCSDCQVEDA